MKQQNEGGEKQKVNIPNKSLYEAYSRDKQIAVENMVGASNVPLRFNGLTRSVKGREGGEWLDKYRKLYSQLGSGCLCALVGGRGVGKTQMACDLILQFILDNCKAAFYMTAIEFFIAIKDSYKTDTPESKTLAVFYAPQFLVIDEVQERGQTDWEDRLLTHIINKRYADLKDTLLISNQNKNDFIANIGKSIASRMNETGGIIECNWKGYR